MTTKERKISTAEVKVTDKDFAFRIGRATFKVIPPSGNTSYAPAEGVRIVDDTYLTNKAFSDISPFKEPYWAVTQYQAIVSPDGRLQDGVILQPGETLKIGRAEGIEVIGVDGKSDLGANILNDSPFGSILKTDDTLSRQHLEIQATDLDHVRLRDLGSKNGTFLIEG